MDRDYSIHLTNPGVWEYYGADDGLWHTYGETFQQWFVRQLRDGLARYKERVKRAADEELKRCSPSSGKNKASLRWNFGKFTRAIHSSDHFPSQSEVMDWHA